MKLKIASDLHLNCYNKEEQDRIREHVIEGEYDYLVLPGDIMGSKMVARKWPWPKMIYVHGNHEFYREGYDRDEETNRVEVHDGRKFVCSTMFSKLNPSDLYDIVHGITDFGYVTVDRFESLHQEAIEFLRKEVEKDCIVVTHFVPTFQSMHPQYKDSRLNSFFITELSDLIIEREPAVWIYGHTHSTFDFMLGKTRMICNPFGYNHEPTNYDENCIIEV